MSILMSILPAIIVFGVLIAIHEWGHFIACRLTGVKVDKFSIGFGPEIIHWQGRETRYAISLFPLGGYVKPAGEEVSDLEGENGPKPGDFLAAPVGSRIFIVCAGVIMNYILAFVLLAAVLMMGRPVPEAVVGQVREGYPAKAAGIQQGDKIVALNREEVKDFIHLVELLQDSKWPTVTVSVFRGEGQAIKDIQITPLVEKGNNIFGDPVEEKILGIAPSPTHIVHQRYGVLESFPEALKLGWDYTYVTHKAIFYLMIGKLSPKMMSGPIGIVKMSGDAAKAGISSLLFLAAILSISLAVINLFPIPGLDGGHLVFLIWEAIFRKPVDLKIQESFTRIGITLLMCLMVFVFYNDIVNLQLIDKVKGMFVRS